MRTQYMAALALLMATSAFAGVIATNPSIALDIRPLDGSPVPNGTWSMTLKVDNCTTITTSSISAPVEYGIAVVELAPQELCGYTILGQILTVNGTNYSLPDQALEPIDAKAVTVPVFGPTRVRWLTDVD